MGTKKHDAGDGPGFIAYQAQERNWGDPSEIAADYVSSPGGISMMTGLDSAASQALWDAMQISEDLESFIFELAKEKARKECGE